MHSLYSNTLGEYERQILLQKGISNKIYEVINQERKQLAKSVDVISCLCSYISYQESC